MRKFAYISYAVLIDDKGLVREVYQAHPGTAPASLLKFSELLRQLSHNQSFMTGDCLRFLVSFHDISSQHHDSKYQTAMVIILSQGKELINIGTVPGFLEPAPFLLTASKNYDIIRTFSLSACIIN